MKRILRTAAAAALFALSACGGSTSTGSAPVPRSAFPAGGASSTDFTARLPQNSLGGIPHFSLDVSLYDAPLTFGADDQVNLALLGVNLVDSSNVAHPMYTLPTPVIVNLLTLKQQAQQFQTNVAVGDYQAIEFIVLPAASSVVASGQIYPVRFGNGAVASPTPLALNSPVNIDGTSGATVKVDIDFNALESVALSNGVAQINPDFVVSTACAQVHGTVHNSQHQPVTSATILVKDPTGKVVNSTITDSHGNFVVHALGAGKLTVAVQNSYTSASGVTVTAHGATATYPPAVGVQLAAGVNLDLGTLAD